MSEENPPCACEPGKTWTEQHAKKIVTPGEFIQKVKMTDEQRERIYNFGIEVKKLESRLERAKENLAIYLESIDSNYKIGLEK